MEFRIEKFTRDLHAICDAGVDNAKSCIMQVESMRTKLKSIFSLFPQIDTMTFFKITF